MKTKLIKFHFIVLLILVVNFIITSIFDFGFNSYAKMTFLLLLFGSGISMFSLNFKPVFKLLVRFYSTFYITIALSVTFLVCTTDKPLTHSLPYSCYETLSTHIPVYRQKDYEIYIYNKKGVLSFLNCGNGFESGYYYIDKKYFIFKTRLGYFRSVYKDGKNTNFEMPMYLIEEEMKNINVENDSIYIDFNNHIRAFKIRK